MNTHARDLESHVEAFTHRIRLLYNEVDCRIEHGAESGGHLEFVRQQLHYILGLDPRSDKDAG